MELYRNEQIVDPVYELKCIQVGATGGVVLDAGAHCGDMHHHANSENDDGWSMKAEHLHNVLKLGQKQPNFSILTNRHICLFHSEQTTCLHTRRKWHVARHYRQTRPCRWRPGWHLPNISGGVGLCQTVVQVDIQKKKRRLIIIIVPVQDERECVYHYSYLEYIKSKIWENVSVRTVKRYDGDVKAETFVAVNDPKCDTQKIVWETILA